MKIKHIYMAAAVFAAATLAGCEDEKDLVIIDGNLPIKASALYMVGDATPNGWSIDSPTPFTATESDPLVFEWSGSLNAGEMKLCLAPGSWDAPFIRPLEDQSPIGTSDIDNASFQMHAGDPDQKWRVTDAGSYTLTFDLRNWKMSTRYNGGAPEPSKDPISTETLYLVGDATPAGWSIESPTPLEKTGDYTFVYEGELKTGEMKACLVAGSWDVDFVRPASADVEINKDGVAADDFVFTAGPDNKWKVTYRANYRVTFNLAEYTVAVEYLSDVEGGDENPLLSASDVWMIGDATPNGWSLDDAQHFEKADGKDHVFVWQGQLVGGTFKACIIRDFGAPFIRPASGDVTVSKAGVSATDFVYTTDPDDQWQVTEAGEYKITLDLLNYTIKVEVPSGKPAPIETDVLYMIGDATAGGWSLDDAQVFTKEADGVFSWTGDLKEGIFKACTVKDFNAPFLRPSSGNVTVSSVGVSASDFIYTSSPDDQWRVTEAGKYKITFNLKEWTIAAEFVK